MVRATQGPGTRSRRAWRKPPNNPAPGWGEEGEALSDVALRLSFEERAQVMAQVCEAVQAANRLGPSRPSMSMR